MKKLVLGVLGCVSLLVGCANEIIIDDANTKPTGGNQTSSGSSGTGSSGTGSSGTTGGTGTMCVPVDDVPVTSNPTCKELDRIVLVDPVVEADSDGDGALEPGESATLTLTMKDVSGLGFNWYPGVQFASEDASVGVQADTWYYAILPCGEQLATATIKVSPDVMPGKTVTIRAWVDMMNANCTGTFAIEVPIKIQ